jgi:hypothetical protein
MDSQLKSDITAILALCDAVLAADEKMTQGKWRVNDSRSEVWNEHRLTLANCPLTDFYHADSQHEANASGIALFRNVCPAFAETTRDDILFLRDLANWPSPDIRYPGYKAEERLQAISTTFRNAGLIP